MKLDKRLYIMINIIFILLTFLTMLTDTVIFDIVLPLTMLGLSIIWKPYIVILPFILVASQIKLPTEFNNILLNIVHFILYSVFAIKFIKDIGKELNIPSDNIVWIAIILCIYISMASIDYVPAIINGLQTLL